MIGSHGNGRSGDGRWDGRRRRNRNRDFFFRSRFPTRTIVLGGVPTLQPRFFSPLPVLRPRYAYPTLTAARLAYLESLRAEAAHEDEVREAYLNWQNYISQPDADPEVARLLKQRLDLLVYGGDPGVQVDANPTIFPRYGYAFPTTGSRTGQTATDPELERLAQESYQLLIKRPTSIAEATSMAQMMRALAARLRAFPNPEAQLRATDLEQTATRLQTPIGGARRVNRSLIQLLSAANEEWRANRRIIAGTPARPNYFFNLVREIHERAKTAPGLFTADVYNTEPPPPGLPGPPGGPYNPNGLELHPYPSEDTISCDAHQPIPANARVEVLQTGIAEFMLTAGSPFPASPGSLPGAPSLYIDPAIDPGDVVGFGRLPPAREWWLVRYTFANGRVETGFVRAVGANGEQNLIQRGGGGGTATAGFWG